MHAMTELQAEFSSPPNLSRMSRLRDGALQAHRRLEMSICMQRLFASDYSLAEYCQWLVRILGFIDPLERAMAAYSHDVVRLGCDRSSCLRADLDMLGVDDSVWLHAAQSKLRMRLSCPAVRIGLVYALESAGSNGAIIHRALTQQLGPSVNAAVSYFDCYPGYRGRVWSRLGDKIDTLSTFDVETSISATQEVLGNLADWLR